MYNWGAMSSLRLLEYRVEGWCPKKWIWLTSGVGRAEPASLWLDEGPGSSPEALRGQLMVTMHSDPHIRRGTGFGSGVGMTVEWEVSVGSPPNQAQSCDPQAPGELWASVARLGHFGDPT